MLAIFDEKIEIRELCKGVHCVDLGESFPARIYLQKLASIQPSTSLVKFARSPRTDPPGIRGNLAVEGSWPFQQAPTSAYSRLVYANNVVD